MKVATTEICTDTECRAPVSMDFETGDLECENGHKQAAPIPVAEPAPEPELAPAVDQLSAEFAARPVVQDLDMPPAPEVEAAPLTDEQVAAAMGVPVAVTDAIAAAGPAISFEAEPETAAPSATLEAGAWTMDGADLLIVIRIPDPHAQAMINGAEQSEVALATHIQNRVDMALENEWWL